MRRNRSSFSSDPEYEGRTIPLLFQKDVALLVAEVRHVYCGHGVRGNDLEDAARCHARKALPGLQNRQWAKQTAKVERVFGMIFGHAGDKD